MSEIEPASQTVSDSGPCIEPTKRAACGTSGLQEGLSCAYARLSPVTNELRRRLPRAACAADRAGEAAQAVAKSDEGQRLATSASEFTHALFAFLGMLFTALLRYVEGALNMKPPEGATVGNRVLALGGKGVSDVKEWVQRREEDAPGSVEAKVIQVGRIGLNIGAKGVKNVVRNAKGYDGVGKEYVDVVVKAVESVASQLCEEESKVVLDGFQDENPLDSFCAVPSPPESCSEGIDDELKK